MDAYRDDLPEPDRLEVEEQRWRSYLTGNPDISNESLTDVLDQCDRDFFPNIYTLLIIAATLPITASRHDRSDSCMPRLRTHLRESQVSERLDCLALTQIHSDVAVDEQQVIDSFAQANAEWL